MDKTKQIIGFCIVIIFIVAGAILYDASLVPAENLESNINIQELSYKKVPDIVLNPIIGSELKNEILASNLLNKPNDKEIESYLLSDIQQPVILLHFWASWCTPCLIEIPDILQLVEEMNGMVAVVAVSIDTDKKKLDKFMKQLRKEHGNKLDNPNIYWVGDPDKSISLKTFNVARVPETIIINKNRMMVKKIIGENDWLSKETKSHILEAAGY